MGLFSQYAKPLIRQFQNLLDVPAVVLLYHRVDQLHNDQQQLAVSPQHFDEQIAFLRATYNLISIDEFTSRLREKRKFEPGSVILTFDDGYADNYIHALPVLEKYNAQALFYITTSKLNTGEILWWDMLEHIFFALPKLPATLRLTISGKEYSFDLPGNHGAVYQKLHPLIKYTHYEERDRIMNELMKWAGTGTIKDGPYRLLRHDELMAMSKSAACVIGAHTIDHPVLSKLPFEEQSAQIAGSKKILEELTGQTVSHFSYPFGSKHDYNHNSIVACKNAGFEMVAANYPWQVHRFSNKFTVPRYLVRDWDLATFKQKIASFFNS